MRQVGDKYRPVVRIAKVKNKVPTVLLVSGREYVLRPPEMYRQRRKGGGGA